MSLETVNILLMISVAINILFVLHFIFSKPKTFNIGSGKVSVTTPTRQSKNPEGCYRGHGKVTTMAPIPTKKT